MVLREKQTTCKNWALLGDSCVIHSIFTATLVDLTIPILQRPRTLKGTEGQYCVLLWHDTTGNSRAGTHVTWVSLVLKSVCFILGHVPPLRLGAEVSLPRGARQLQKSTGVQHQALPTGGSTRGRQTKCLPDPTFP